MRPDARRLILLAPEPDEETFLRNNRFDAVRQELNQATAAPLNWEINFVGPNARFEDIQANLQSWNRNPCRSLNPSYTLSDGDEYNSAVGSPGRTTFENIDAGLYTNDNAQGVRFVAPTVGNNQNGYSAFLNNVMTDTYYFLQNGLLFQSGAGFVVWADTTVGNQAQFYPAPQAYASGTIYRSSITYTNQVWWMCMGSTFYYDCQVETNATGTNLVADINTSVWFENFNTNTNWHIGFSSPLEARIAKIYLDGIGYAWSNQHRHTSHTCTLGSYPTSTAMSGSLVNWNTAYFNLDYVPRLC